MTASSISVPSTDRRDLAHALEQLTRVAVAITSAVSVDETMEHVSRVAAELIGARQAVTTLADDGTPDDADGPPVQGSVRLTPNELEAPLIGRGGTILGSVRLTGKVDGEFSGTDESLLVQLAALGSVAIEKARLRDELALQETARFREDLLSGISHDMQTPLATIVGLTDVLLDDGIDPDEQRETHAVINRQARNLRGLVQQFLDYSRLASDRELLLRPRPVDVVEVIERAVGVFHHQRDIVVGASHGLPPAHIDPDRFEQMLTNLISNAIKYSDGSIRVVARHQQDRITVDVVDEGPGIDEDELEALFEKFHRGEGAEGTTGTGLGLYITRALVEAHGGELRTHSTPGVGSRFQLRVPVAAAGA